VPSGEGDRPVASALPRHIAEVTQSGADAEGDITPTTATAELAADIGGGCEDESKGDPADAQEES